MDEKQYEEMVRSRLSEKRFVHSMNVAKAAEELAVQNGADPQKARLAGILHDIMKESPPEEQLKIMESSGIMLTDVERSAPKLWHAMAGAAYLQNVLGIEDSEVLNAVRYHTTGRANMSALEKSCLWQILFQTSAITMVCRSCVRQHTTVCRMR